MYGDRGNYDCSKHPGATGYEKQDAAFMARNKVDWYKEDSCYAPSDEPTAIHQYSLMRDALNATGYPIWFATCGWKPWYASDPDGGNKLANSARIGPDTGTGWSAVCWKISPEHCGGYMRKHEPGLYASWQALSMRLKYIVIGPLRNKNQLYVSLLGKYIIRVLTNADAWTLPFGISLLNLENLSHVH